MYSELSLHCLILSRQNTEQFAWITSLFGLCISFKRYRCSRSSSPSSPSPWKGCIGIPLPTWLPNEAGQLSMSSKDSCGLFWITLRSLIALGHAETTRCS